MLVLIWYYIPHFAQVQNSKLSMKADAAVLECELDIEELVELVDQDKDGMDNKDPDPKIEGLKRHSK